MSITIITGASSGVGALLATRLAAAGRTVAAVARSEAKLAALVAEQPHTIPVVADVANWSAAEAAVAKLDAAHGGIEALINNAAVYHRRPVTEERAEDVRRMLQTNVEGVIGWSKAVAARMIPRRQGRIVMVASVAGTRGIPGESVYCASKHAMVGFADALTQELLPHGVNVSILCPGGIDTPLWDTGNYPGDRSQIMRPQEVVEAIEFLLSRPANSIYRRMLFFPSVEWH